MSDALYSERLTLAPFSADVLDAMIRGDADGLQALTGARFSAGIALPLMDDALPHFLDRIRNGEPANWWGWLAIDSVRGEAVGSVGFGGPPDSDGRVLMGYSVYPRYERMGYATEAAGLLIAWAFAQPHVTAVRATIPPWNTPSIRVAEKIGMVVVGEAEDAGVGKVIVYERKGTVRERA
ncbi:MAG: GNAT family N-acetyltransferase [Longimicrobiales bacterium]